VGSAGIRKAREVLALLESRGFVIVRQRGSHRQLRHPDGRSTTLPFHHAGGDISPIILRRIERDLASRAAGRPVAGH